MTAEEFRDLLDGYGPHLATWPDKDKAAAEKLLQHDGAVRTALSDAIALDRMVANALGRDAASASLRDRLDRIPVQHPQPRLRGRWRVALMQPWGLGAAAASASAVLGLAIGLATAPLPSNDPSLIDATALVYGFDEEDLS